MGLEDAGRQVMLEEFGAVALRCRLYDDLGAELSGEGYEEQTISWTYNGTDVILEADDVEGIVAEFNVPAGTVKYVGFLNVGATLLAQHDLAENAETFTNPGVYQLTAASLELDPS